MPNDILLGSNNENIDKNHGMKNIMNFHVAILVYVFPPLKRQNHLLDEWKAGHFLYFCFYRDTISILVLQFRTVLRCYYFNPNCLVSKGQVCDNKDLGRL